MKRMIAVLVLLSVVAGCGEVEREIIVPGSPPADDAAIYLAGFMDGYIGIRPGDSYAGDASESHSAAVFRPRPLTG